MALDVVYKIRLDGLSRKDLNIGFTKKQGWKKDT